MENARLLHSTFICMLQLIINPTHIVNSDFGSTTVKGQGEMR